MTAASYLLSAFSQDTPKDIRPGKQHGESVTQLSLTELFFVDFFSSKDYQAVI